MTGKECGAMTALDAEVPWNEVIKALHAFIARRVRNAHDAAEITSTVVERVHRRAEQLPEDDRFTAWLLAVARNAVIDHYRASARRRDLPSDTLPDRAIHVDLADGDHSAEDVRAELAACVAPLVAELPAHYREAITLTEFHGLTQAEAAERASLSLSGMKSRVQRARHHLRARFENCCDITLDARGAPIRFEPRAQQPPTRSTNQPP